MNLKIKKILISWSYFFFDSSFGYILQILPVVLLSGIVFLFIRKLWKRKRNQLESNVLRECILVAFVCYLTGLIALIETPNNLWGSIWYRIIYGHPSGTSIHLFSGSWNFAPTIIKYLSGEWSGGSWVNFMFLGNILLFVPMGVFLPIIWKTITFKRIIGIGFLISIILEIIQPVLGRSFDVDDLIMNTLGTIIGYLLVRLAQAIFKNRFKEKA